MTTQASFDYLKPLDLYARQKPYEVFIPLSNFSDPTVPRTNLEFETKEVLVHDARDKETEFSLDEHGFCFTTHKTHVASFSDREGIETQYIPEVQSLLRAHIPGVKRLFSFDWRVSCVGCL